MRSYRTYLVALATLFAGANAHAVTWVVSCEGSVSDDTITLDYSKANAVASSVWAGTAEVQAALGGIAKQAEATCYAAAKAFYKSKCSQLRAEGIESVRIENGRYLQSYNSGLYTYYMPVRLVLYQQVDDLCASAPPSGGPRPCRGCRHP
jgi:hypothetical protein